MSRLTPDDRKSLVKAYKNCRNISLVAFVFGTCFNTAYSWIKRAAHAGKESFKDKPRHKEGKVTLEVEMSILAIRNTFNWGTARIQQGLMSLPSFMKKAIPFCVQNVSLSRTAINNILKKHGINGYEKENKSWKFFRAKKKNELWQLDIKGPFVLQGKKYWFVVCIDDYSRYLLLAEQLEHVPHTEEITSLLGKLESKPENILTDNAKIFARQWKLWCMYNEIKALFAHPYYPQDKGKVERTIRNIVEEFIDLLQKFPEWLNGMINDYRSWFNNHRFHRGIGTMPALLYGVVGNFT